MRGPVVSFLCKACVIQTVPCCDAVLSGKEVTCVLSSAILDVVEKRDVFRYCLSLNILLKFSKMKEYQTVLKTICGLFYI